MTINNTSRLAAAAVLALSVLASCASPNNASTTGAPTATYSPVPAAPPAATEPPTTTPAPSSLFAGDASIRSKEGYTWQVSYHFDAFGQPATATANDAPGYESATITPTGSIEYMNTTPGGHIPPDPYGSGLALKIAGLYRLTRPVCRLLNPQAGPNTGLNNSGTNGIYMLPSGDYCVAFFAGTMYNPPNPPLALTFSSLPEGEINADLADFVGGPDIYALIGDDDYYQTLTASGSCQIMGPARPIPVLATAPAPPKSCLSAP